MEPDPEESEFELEWRISFSRASKPIIVSSACVLMAAAIGEMHSNLDRASTHVILPHMGFSKRSNNPAATVDGLFTDGSVALDKARSRRGSGPKAGMCSKRTG